jgi:DTW domain-containing protein YfiP
MQKKIGTLLDENLLKKAKEKALAQHTTLSHIFAEALSEYLQRKKQASSSFSTVEASFGALKISTKALKSVLAEDIYETE